jgi:osmoprotectant transport system ATP-binding protein
VLSEGGQLEQYDTPAALLGSPASPFVREFVGTDRGIRRLAVTPITHDVLDPLPTDGGTDLPAVPLGGSAYDALGTLLTSATEHAVVTEEGRPVGVLSRARVLGLGAVD